MSFISHLSIQGIRSFNSEEAETIEFKSPLTLICGSNGCGKTTIIECLKFATTGILPPNSKGGAFLHDPDLSHRQMTNAQIKLGFLSVQGQSMLVSRTMSLTKKGKDKAIFKTVETQLSKINNHEKTSISNNVSVVDGEISNYLGVSKAILDYVVFCHQDESLWPLSEPSLLKKKFDDIFQASQYTKVLEAFKVINKEMAVDIKLLEKSVEYLVNDKKRARKLEENLNELRGQAGGLNSTIDEVNTQIKVREQELDMVFNSNQEFQSILSKYEQLTYSKTTLVQQIDRLKSSIEIYPDSVETLMGKLNNFSDLIDEYTKEIDTLTGSNNQLESNISQTRIELNDLNKLQGSLSSKKSDYDKNMIVLDKELNGSNRVKFERDLSRTVDTSLKDLETHKVHSETVKGDRRKVVQELSEQISNQTNLKSIKTETKEELAVKIKKLTETIDNSNLNEDNLKYAQTELKNLKKKYDESKSSDFIKTLTEDINKNKEKLTSLELELDQLNEKIQLVNREREVVVRINYLKEMNDQKNISIDSSLGKVTKLMKVTRDNFETIFNDQLKAITQEYTDLESKTNTLIKERNSISTLIQSNKTANTQLVDKLQQVKSRILAVIEESEIDEYDTITEELEENRQIAFESLNTYEVSKQFKIKAIEIGKKTHNCLMCHRSFEGDQLETYLGTLESDVGKTNQEFKQVFEDAKKDLEQHKSISSDIVTYKTLIGEIQQNEMDSKQFSKTLESLQDECSSSSNKLKELKEKFDEIKDLKPLINDLKKDLSQVISNGDKITNLQKDLGDNVGDESIDTLNKLQQDKSLELKNLRVKVNKDSDVKYNKEREISKLDSNIKDKELEIKNIESSLKDLKQSQKMIEEYTQQVNGINEHIIDIDSKLKSLIKDKGLEVEKNSEIFQELDDKESELSSKYNEVNDQLKTIKNLIESVNSFEQNDLEKIEQTDKDIKTASDKIDSLVKQLESNNTQLRSLEKKVHESSNVKSTIRDNIDYKTYLGDLDKLEQDMADLNVEEASKMKEQYLTETERLNSLLQGLNSDNAGRLGQVKQINEHIKSLETQLNTEYKDIDKKYQEEWIKLQINLFASNDITTYSKNLDKAIMKYHSMKMSEINKILKDLWVRTYKGADIDYIAVKSDVSTQGKGRSYNYRVVMQKGGKELDMRGRCSAGQKVLTCILIRLALAECFGSNCGMIALDEPTTNLDVENAEGLAVALNELIHARKYQKNFQLIIITHDMDFLSHINGGNFIDNFYRVSKDESLYSRIRSYPIQVLGEE